MKEELLNIAMQSLSDDDVKEIVKDKFKKMIERAVEDAFKWGDAEKAIKRKVTEVMVPYIEKYDFSEYLPKLDSVLTEIVNSDACMGNKTILENFRDLMIEPEQKEIKVTDLFKIWKKRCEKEIDTSELDIDYDVGVPYSCIGCEMSVEELDKPSWSNVQRAVITFENEHDESLNIEIPISKLVWDSGKEEPYTLSLKNDLMISSLRYMDDFKILLMRLTRARTSIIIDKDYDTDDIFPEAEPEASFS
ncbi:hypothetical protein [[Ruminococcus] torques]|uniref:hypothetical protein n=1 Tax=[Ruminococcus] torques TaxID=33039 RepID=UPI00399C0779